MNKILDSFKYIDFQGFQEYLNTAKHFFKSNYDEQHHVELVQRIESIAQEFLNLQQMSIQLKPSFVQLSEHTSKLVKSNYHDYLIASEVAYLKMQDNFKQLNAMMQKKELQLATFEVQNNEKIQKIESFNVFKQDKENQVLFLQQKLQQVENDKIQQQQQYEEYKNQNEKLFTKCQNDLKQLSNNYNEANTKNEANIQNLINQHKIEMEQKTQKETEHTQQLIQLKQELKELTNKNQVLTQENLQKQEQLLTIKNNKKNIEDSLNARVNELQDQLTILTASPQIKPKQVQVDQINNNSQIQSENSNIIVSVNLFEIQKEMKVKQNLIDDYAIEVRDLRCKNAIQVSQIITMTKQLNEYNQNEKGILIQNNKSLVEQNQNNQKLINSQINLIEELKNQLNQLQTYKQEKEQYYSRKVINSGSIRKRMAAARPWDIAKIKINDE